jgi:hypothetical protein
MHGIYNTKLFISVIKTKQLMPCREIITVCSESHTKLTDTLYEQTKELRLLKLVVSDVTIRLQRPNISVRR